MTLSISVGSEAEARAILRSLYEADRSAVYFGADREIVSGLVVTARYHPQADLVEVTSSALSTEAGLRDYLPSEYR
jgi:hypothetical protein